MTLYHRFEQVVSWILSVFVAIIVAVALFRLIVSVSRLLVTGTLNPLSPQAFEEIFGMLLTLLIAMEFNHSVQAVGRRRYSIVEVKTVVLISILSLLRRFIVLDIGATAPSGLIAAMAFAVLALGVVYWLMRERDDVSA